MRIGVLGGSFDPVHVGHLWIALFAREQLLLDEVLFVPAANPPHKGGTKAPYSERVEILRRCLDGWPAMRVAELEDDLSQTSYTIETLRRLKSSVDAGSEIWLLLGGDSLRDIKTWREHEEILRIAHLGVYGRPGVDAPVPGGSRVRWIDGPACGLSSSLVRARLREGLSIRGLVPDAALRMLASSSSYGEGTH